MTRKFGGNVAPIWAALVLMEKAAAELRLALDAQNAEPAEEQPVDTWPTSPDDPDLVDTATAALRSCKSPDTIRTWCNEKGIGRVYGSRWRVSLRRLKIVTES